MSRPLALYIHWPYCVSKCPYCDFNSHVGATIDHAAFRTAYAREIATYAARLPGRTVTSIFFGGGTPSLMEPATVAAVIDGISAAWRMDDQVEITLEANPSSAEADKFSAIKAAGVNRLSLGIQSLYDADLQFLGRAHNAAEGRRAIELAARIFPRFSFDLIYARKGQSLTAWEQELREALTLAGEHLSLYQLTIEPTTQFYTLAQRGVELTAPDDTAAAMYEQTQAIMAEAGLPAYEISNHAKPGAASRHNLTYWHYEDYVGIGAGAHGRFCEDTQRYATDNHRAPNMWLNQVMTTGCGLKNNDPLDDATAMREALMMGLRLTEGLDRARWAEKFREPLEAWLDPRKIARLQEEGFITLSTERLRATAAGLQRLNAMLSYLVSDPA